MVPGKPISCQAAGCEVDLRNCGRSYFIHKRICPFHSQEPSFTKRGCDDPSLQWRFCFKCSKLEPVSKFDGLKRNCRDHLNKIKKRSAQMAAAASPQAPSTASPDSAAAQLAELTSAKLRQAAVAVVPLAAQPAADLHISRMMTGPRSGDSHSSTCPVAEPDHAAGLAGLAKLVCEQLLRQQGHHEQERQSPDAAALHPTQGARADLEAAQPAAKAAATSPAAASHSTAVMQPDVSLTGEVMPQQLPVQQASSIPEASVNLLMDHLLQMATDKQLQHLTHSTPVAQQPMQPRFLQPAAHGNSGGFIICAAGQQQPAPAVSLQAAMLPNPAGEGKLQEQQQAAQVAAITAALMSQASKGQEMTQRSLTAAAAAAVRAPVPAAGSRTKQQQQLQNLQLKLQQLSGQCELLNMAVSQVTAQLHSAQQDIMACIAADNF